VGVSGRLPGTEAEDPGLDGLVPGIQVAGVTASGTAEIVATEWHGRDVVTVGSSLTQPSSRQIGNSF
jgi:hypothetical protein